MASPAAARVLPVALAGTAGAADAVGLLGFGLFTAHITGNLALLAVHLVTGRPASAALLLSIPVFIVAVALATLLARGLAAGGRAPLRPLLVAQFLLLAAFFAAGVAGGRQLDPDPAVATAGALLGVSAMAVQNTLVQVALTGVPPTTVMTTNLTRLTRDTVDLVRPDDPAAVARARRGAGRTGAVVAGFLGGAGLGAAGYALAGTRAVLVPAVLALLALLLRPSPRFD